jgi:septum formation protein
LSPTPDAEQPLILASRSPRRQEAMAALGLAFRVAVSEVEQTAGAIAPGADPTDPVPIALAKARDIGARHALAFVLAGDTIVAHEGEALGKPAGPAEARAMLRRLAGATHTVRTGLALLHLRRGFLATAEVASDVVMRQYDDAEIVRYVESGEPLDCAGAYDVHRQGGALVAAVTGCFSAVVGLPIAATAALLRRAGLAVPREPAAVCARLYGRPCPAATPQTAGLCNAHE